MVSIKNRVDSMRVVETRYKLDQYESDELDSCGNSINKGCISTGYINVLDIGVKVDFQQRRFEDFIIEINKD